MPRRHGTAVAAFLCLISLAVYVPGNHGQIISQVLEARAKAPIISDNQTVTDQPDNLTDDYTTGPAFTDEYTTRQAFTDEYITGPGGISTTLPGEVASTEEPGGPGFMAIVQYLGERIKDGLMNEVFSIIAEHPDIMTEDGNIDFPTLFKYIQPIQLLRKVVAELGSLSTFLPNNSSLVSQQCYDDVIDMIDLAVTGNGAAIAMIDAMGKPTSGIERGSLYFTGSYDECYKAEIDITKGEKIGQRTAPASKTIGPRFCRAKFNIDSLVKSLGVDTRGYPLKLIWGTCLPASCQNNDVKNLFQLGLLRMAQIPIYNVECDEDKNLSEDTSAIVALVILSFFAFMVVAGTVYDICKSMLKKDEDQVPSIAHIEVSKPIEAPNSTFDNKGYEVVEVPLPSGYVHHREDDSYKSEKASNGGSIVVMNNGQSFQKQQVNGVTETGNTGNKKATLQQVKPEAPVIDRIFLSFSAYSNVPRLLNAKSNPNAIGCIHGIRFISLTWVVLGHSYNYGIVSNRELFTTNNMLDFPLVLQRFTFQAVIAAGYAVDTFFVMSAFLMTWLHLKERAKKKKACTLGDSLMFYFHRFWRLTPIYMIVLMLFTCLYRYLMDGPFSPNRIPEVEDCRTTWWTNLLYINNLVEVDKQCMSWSWYLSNDMQFYVVSPIILLIMHIRPFFGGIAAMSLAILGVAISLWKEHIYPGGFLTMLSDGGNYWKNVYIVPWCRMHCWFIGMLLGLIIYKRGKKPLRSKYLYVLGWALAIGVGLFLTYIPYTENKKDGTEWNKEERAFHESFGRAAWGICIAWVIFACHTGRGGIVNSILSWNGFIPLSRLTYAVYLVHPICMVVYMYNRRNEFFVSDLGIAYLYLGHLCMSYMVAFVMSLTFEAPFMQLEKIMFHTRRKKD